jgi:hypothetical protein
MMQMSEASVETEQVPTELVELKERIQPASVRAERRPSHANRCQELRREAMQEEYSSLPPSAGLPAKIRRFIERLMRRVA